ncbi:hypothetical protein NMG60_11002892 [Bertholletia excelsa]
MIIDEFPERSGQPECNYFMKTGDSKLNFNAYNKQQMIIGKQCSASSTTDQPAMPPRGFVDDRSIQNRSDGKQKSETPKSETQKIRRISRDPKNQSANQSDRKQKFKTPKSETQNQKDSKKHKKPVG